MSRKFHTEEIAAFLVVAMICATAIIVALIIAGGMQ